MMSVNNGQCNHVHDPICIIFRSAEDDADRMNLAGLQALTVQDGRSPP